MPNIMNRSFLALITGASVAFNALATDRVVSPSGTYNTISSAIAASDDGDMILVQSSTYNENIALTKSLSILPLVEGSRYTVVGSGAVAMTNGGRVLISGGPTCGPTGRRLAWSPMWRRVEFTAGRAALATAALPRDFNRPP